MISFTHQLGERRDINTEKYWRHEFPSLMNSREVIKYIVLSVEPIINTTSLRPSNKKRGSGADRKLRLAEVIVARERDFGINDNQYTCTTHLGNILREGDMVLGYDLVAASWTKELEASKILVYTLPLTHSLTFPLTHFLPWHQDIL